MKMKLLKLMYLSQTEAQKEIMSFLGSPIEVNSTEFYSFYRKGRLGVDVRLCPTPDEVPERWLVRVGFWEEE